MQVLETWDPLNLPRGSVRALVTLTLLGVLWALMLLERPVPLPLAMVVLVATAHYFGARSASPAAAGRQPLFLPRGSVRLIIVAGFVAVGYVLRTRGRLTFDIKDPNAAVFLLVGALVAGAVLRKVLDVLTRGRAIAPRRWFENLKAVAVIVAAAILAFVCFDGSSEAARTAELVAAPLIVFYFGSRN